MSNVPSNFFVVAPLGLAVFGLFHSSESVALGQNLADVRFSRF